MTQDPFAGTPLPGTDAFYNQQNQQDAARDQQEAPQQAEDPARGTIDEVKDRVEAGEVSVDDVLRAEEEGKARKGLLEWLRER
jgi:outer membrane protein TolC